MASCLDELHGVLGLALEENRVVQVCTRTTPGADEQTDLITEFKFLPLFSKDFAEMPIAGRDPAPVIDFDQPSVFTAPARRPRPALRPTTAFMESEPAGLLPGPPYKPLAAYNRPCTI